MFPAPRPLSKSNNPYIRPLYSSFPFTLGMILPWQGWLRDFDLEVKKGCGAGDNDRPVPFCARILAGGFAHYRLRRKEGRTTMRVDIGDCRLFFDVEGCKLRPDGPRMKELPTLLLLHGGPGFDHSSFKPVFSSLADIAQVVYLDHRGQGRSDRSIRELWNLDQWANDVKSFCDALEIERPIVLGNSFGGMVAMAYASRFPDHPAKLVLSSTAARMRLDRVLQMFEKLGGPQVREVAGSFWENPSPENRATYMRVCMPLYNPSGGLANPNSLARIIWNFDVGEHFIRGEQRTFNLLPELHRINCPSLVLAGAHDPVCTMEDMKEIAEAITPSVMRFEQFADAGHGVFRDQPERALKILREFIAG
jgi:proline-specific peptidase